MQIDLDRKPGCVVTGVAGFVGSHLAERLLRLGCDVVGVDNFFSGKRENLEALALDPGFSFYEQSVTEPGLLTRIKERHPQVSICFHLAAIVSVPYSVDHPEQCVQVNHTATVTLLGESRRLGLDAFVFAGSAAEYGTETRMPLKESYATEGTERLSPYGETKYVGSRAVAAERVEPRGVALRCFNIFGPRQDPSSPYSGVISRFLSMAIEGESLTIFGDGHQTRDFIYVGDVVEAYVIAAGLAESGAGPAAGIYNIGAGGRISVLHLAEVIQSLTGNRKSISFFPQREGDVRHSQADISRFATATGWRPKVTFEEGLKRTLQWMQGMQAS
jgi:UDP-glucose 4-epimerase